MRIFTNHKVSKLNTGKLPDKYVAKYAGAKVYVNKLTRFNYQEIRKSNFDMVVDLLEKADIDYFIVPDLTNRNYRIGIHAKDRHKLIDSALAVDNDSSIHISLIDGGKHYKRHLPVPAVVLNKKFLEGGTILRFCRFYGTQSGGVFAGMELGCDLEFWRQGSAISTNEIKSISSNLGTAAPVDYVKESIVAPRKNKLSSVVHEDDQKVELIKIGNKKYKTLRPFNITHVDEVDFEIDVVYTWVDSSDIAWQEQYNKYKNEPRVHKANNDSARWLSRDELKYSLRSIDMYGHVIRNIYIVTMGQKPEWLDDSHPKITIVDHKDIFEDKSALPVFNSHAIESQLHHIKGLAEKYLYLNDDFFFGGPVDIGAYYTSNGLSKVVDSDHQFGSGKPTDDEPAPSSAGKNVRRLLEESYGRSVSNKLKHTPYPQMKSLSYEMEEKYNKEYKRTMYSRFRNKNDISFAGTFSLNYAYLNGKAIKTERDVRVITLGKEGFEAALARLALERGKLPSFCLNDGQDLGDKGNYVSKKAIEAMEYHFPFRAPWEK